MWARNSENIPTPAVLLNVLTRDEALAAFPELKKSEPPLAKEKDTVPGWPEKYAIVRYFVDRYVCAT